VGFVAAGVADAERLIGEVVMVAADPAAQRRGIGGALTEHAAARRVDERSASTCFPNALYFRSLHPS
jgi:ribosomal protein S18 acetylase RimI-like enzyme